MQLEKRAGGLGVNEGAYMRVGPGTSTLFEDAAEDLWKL
jgi:hypothetical protein